MTLPTTITLPSRDDFNGEESDKKYQNELVNRIQDMYESITENVNGHIRNNAETDQAKWTPTLSAAVGVTFTYAHQYGWSLRQGLMTELWFDIEWTGVSALIGNISVDLPYKVITSDGRPFVGTCIPYNWNYTGNLTFYINAQPDTYLGQIWGSRDGGVAAAAPVQNSGRMMGHIRYIGVDNE